MHAAKQTTFLSWAAICLAAVCLTGAAQASDHDKRPLFNTFYLPAERGAYVLTLNQDRTFHLAAPFGGEDCGTFVASDDEIALMGRTGVRHFAYGFDRNGNVTFTPTRKDTPGCTGILAAMPPVGRGNSTAFIAACNWRPLPVAHERYPAPVVAVPAVVVRGERDYDRHAYYGRGERGFDRHDDHGRGQANGRGRYETRSERVLVEAAHYETRFVPPVYETRRLPYGRTQPVLVQPGCHERVLVPARYQEQQVRVWVNGR